MPIATRGGMLGGYPRSTKPGVGSSNLPGRTMNLLLPGIPDFDRGAAAAAAEHQRELTKPPGSLGRLEELAIWYAGARGCFPVAVPGPAELFVFAADHGVAAEGVSAYPAEVTAAMVANFRGGGAAVSVLARQCAIAMTVVDVGVNGDLSGGDGGASGAGSGARSADGDLAEARFVSARVCAGTRNFRHEPAMARAEAVAAIEVGLKMAAEAAGRGAELLLGGEMGIGNSTAAAALLCAFSGGDPAEMVGRGTGVDDAGLTR